MYHIDNPERMTPEDRAKEVAATLATGFLRLRRRRGYVPDATSGDAREQEVPAENSRN